MKRIHDLNQLSLPFGEGRTAALSIENREKAFWFLVSFCLFFLGLYVYAINATAHNIAIRQHLEREMVELSTELSSLEFAHIELENAVTLEIARELGFSEVKKPLYVTRQSAGSLTLNTAR